MQLIKKYKLIFISSIVFFLLVLTTALIKVPYDVVSPASINQVDKVIQIDSEYTETGSFNTVSVYSYTRVSLLTYLFALCDRKTTISKTYVNSSLSNVEQMSSGTIQKNVSIVNSLISAYEAAKLYGYEANIEYHYEGYIIESYYNYMTPNTLKIGDIVTKIGDYSLLDYNISTALANAEKDSVSLNKNGIEFTVKRNNEEKVFTLTKNSYIDYYGKESSGYGISGYDYYIIDNAIPSFTIKKSLTYGPSGGFLQSLSIFNALCNDIDITNGLKIVGTGTMSIKGKIGQIGGIYQKVICADMANADTFFIPVDRRNGFTYDYIKISQNDTWMFANYDSNIKVSDSNIPYINKGVWWIGDMQTNYSAYGSIVMQYDENNLSNETNYLEAYRSYMNLKNTDMEIAAVSSLEEAINYLFMKQNKIDKLQQYQNAYYLYNNKNNLNLSFEEWKTLIKVGS